MCNFATQNGKKMGLLQDIQKPIQKELASCAEQFRQTLHHDNPLLATAVNHVLNERGKMVRPTLVMLSARMSGEVNQKVMDVALALELLHTASLVHDDVVDESDRRRGQKSVNALMTNQIAVLVGDFILSRALHHAANTGDARIMDAVAALGQTLADGELLQLSNIDTDILDETSYYAVIRRKTASMFAAAAQLGTLAAGGTDNDCERMRQYGQLVGSCFQIRDDIFDYEENDVGKPVGNDMKEGKLTLPVIHAINKTQDCGMRKKAMAVRKGEATEEDIKALVAFTKEKGGLDYALWAMSELRVMADGLIDESKDAEIAESLHKFVTFVSTRNF